MKYFLHEYMFNYLIKEYTIFVFLRYQIFIQYPMNYLHNFALNIAKNGQAKEPAAHHSVSFPN